MLTELIEYGHKNKGTSEVYTKEIKQNIQGTNSEGEETEIQIKDLEQKEEINIRLEQNKETIPKNEERLRNLQDNFKRSNIGIKGVPEGKEEDQEIENLFRKIMKENLPKLVKDIDIQVQEAQRVPKKLDPRKNTPGHIIITLPKIKDKKS